MPTLSQLSLSILLPAIICGLFFSILYYLRARDGEKRYIVWLTAVTLGVGYIIGHIAIEGRIVFIPKESLHWLLYLSLFGIGSGYYWGSSQLRCLISQLIYAVVIPRILLNSYFRYTWGPVEGIIWWICLTIGIIVIWNIFQQNYSILPTGATSPFVFFGMAGGTALVLALSGSLRLAQHCGVLVGIFAGIWLAIVILKRSITSDTNNNWFEFPINTVPVITFLFVGLWLNGYFYAEVPATSVLLLAISPILAQVGRFKAFKGLKGNKTAFIQIIFIALCVSIAIIIAVVNSGFLGEDTY